MFRLVPAIIVIIAFSSHLFGKEISKKPTAYFACEVNEELADGKTDIVTVKFAIENFDNYPLSGELVYYPGSDEDSGMIAIESSVGREYPMVMNLNGQGGDLRFTSRHVWLWGDGDGYQFTDLVIWDVDDSDEQEDTFEGYVRDYGPAYAGGAKTFKQFITCKRSASVL